MVVSDTESHKSDVPATISKDTKEYRSVLSDGIVIKGDWQSRGVVHFGGEITGNLVVDVLIITETGKVEGNVRAKSVVVEGYLRGEIEANDVCLSSNASVIGRIETETLQVDSGAQVECEVTAKDKAPLFTRTKLD
ncbi:bactofilin family protein [Nereida sp.]|uniref:bactofilin family protein n=1 Tax=Nereida sp. TaxID=2736090 RepID=UPI003F699644